MPHIKELKNTTEISDLCHKTNELTLNKLEMYQDIAISEYQIDIIHSYFLMYKYTKININVKSRMML